MANYKKSFNFRNGVQVDDDNFIINANGLVGIGTSIPTELLDIYGGIVKVTGLVTATSLYAKNSIVENLKVDQGINASGVITGTVFSGSASGLTDIYAIAVDGWYITGGTISTSSKVGIGTTNPSYQFQVGNDPVNTDFEGLTIDINGNLYSSGDFSFGNANISGLTTTKDFEVTGIATISDLNVSGLTTTKDFEVTGIATISDLNVLDLTTTKDFEVTGVSTIGSLNVSGLTTTKDLIVTGIATISDLNVSGLTTTKNLIVTGVSTIGSLNVSGLTTTKNLIVTGIATIISDLNVLDLTTTKDFEVTGIATISDLNVLDLTTTKDFEVTGIATISDLNVSGLTLTDELHVNNTISGVANTALGLSGTPNINVGVITASKIEITSNKLVIDDNGNANYSGVITASNFIGSLTGVASTAASLIKNINIEIGIATVNNSLYTNSIGIGTNLPNSDLHLRKNSSSRIQITSDSEESSLVIGRSVNTQDKSASLRFGDTSGIFSYSNSRSLDIINYDNGNINFYLESGTIGIDTGSFYWNRRPNFSNLMTLTYDGKLGIGITNPSNTLHVVGTSTVTEDIYVGRNVSVVGSLDVKTILTANILTVSSNINATLNGDVNGNVYSNTGISTFNQIDVTGIATLSNIITNGIGIATDNIGSNYLQVRSPGITGFFVNNQGQVGVNTDIINSSDLYLVSIDACAGVGLFKGVGVGTTSPQCFADFSSAGYSAGGFGNSLQFMLPPKITTTVRNNLFVVEGAFIYNTTNKRLEIYNGDGWSGIATVP
jgi:hypothetical protein